MGTLGSVWQGDETRPEVSRMRWAAERASGKQVRVMVGGRWPTAVFSMSGLGGYSEA